MGKGCRGLMMLATWFLFASASFAANGLVGSTGMELVESQTSVLGLDLKALEWEICGNPDPPTTRGAVLVIASDGGGNNGDRSRLAVEVLDEQPGTLEGTTLASVRPVQFDLWGGAILVLSCGRFTYRVTLDEQVVQPISILTLVAGDRSGTYGTCAGNLAIETRLILTPYRGSEPIYDAPRSLTLQISGHWALSDTPAMAGESPLVLLADQVGGRIVPKPVCLSAVDDVETSLCFAGVTTSIEPRP